MPKRTHEAAMQTKQLILDAAYNLFSSKSFEKTSLSDIAREARVTRGAIYWHFEDKNELLLELCKDKADKFNLALNLQRAAEPDEPDPLGQLKKWMLSHASDQANLFFSTKFVRNLRAIAVGSTGSDEVRARIKELIEYSSMLMLSGVKNAISHHQLPSDVDPELICIYLKGILYSYCNRDEIYFFCTDRPHIIFRQLVDFAFAHLADLKRQGAGVTQQHSHTSPFYKSMLR